jgi:hypothetical protein
MMIVYAIVPFASVVLDVFLNVLVLDMNVQYVGVCLKMTKKRWHVMFARILFITKSVRQFVCVDVKRCFAKQDICISAPKKNAQSIFVRKKEIIKIICVWNINKKK